MAQGEVNNSRCKHSTELKAIGTGGKERKGRGGKLVCQRRATPHCHHLLLLWRLGSMFAPNRCVQQLDVLVSQINSPTHPSVCKVLLLFSASAIAVAPFAPMLFAPMLYHTEESSSSSSSSSSSRETQGVGGLALAV